MQGQRCVRRLVLVGLCLTAAPRARAGNTDEVLVGDDAALAGGAVTARVASGSSIYYNPAGLANVERHELNLSATAVNYAVSNIRGAVRGPDGLSEDASISEFLIIPSNVSFLLQLAEGLTAGFGIFAVEATGEQLRVDATVTGDTDTEWRLATQDHGFSYRAGPGIGWAPTTGFNVGASLLFVQDSFSSVDHFSGTERLADGTDLFLTESTQESFFGLGAQLALGMQWTPTPAVSLGVAVHSPAFDIATTEQVDILDAAALEDEETAEVLSFSDSFSDQASESFSGAFIPWRARVGVSVNTEQGWVSLDGDYQTPLSDMDRKGQWNARLGTVQHLDGLWWLGGGLFTDRNIYEEVDGIGGIDFYGATAGIRFGKVRRLHPDEAYEGMTTITTVALRYAYGSGQAAGLAVDEFGGGQALDAIGLVPADVTVHEVGVNIGSSFSF